MQSHELQMFFFNRAITGDEKNGYFTIMLSENVSGSVVVKS